MDQNLAHWVHGRLAADGALSEDAALLVMAALDGPDGLADLTGTSVPTTIAEEAANTQEPAGVFLTKVAVTGFRGIGERSELHLTPGPSLTVVSGRNGSGKSSLAEALEFALTGETLRGERRVAQWVDAWRNVHVDQRTQIEVTVAEQGIGETVIRTEWGPDAELCDSETSTQRRGAKRQTGTESLGWNPALETYRPLLSYDELGSLLNKRPSELYDALSTMLGLEQLSDALNLLDRRRKELDEPKRALAAAKKELHDLLAASDDDRATNALALVGSRTPDASAIRALATGVSGADDLARWLRSLADLSLPSDDECLTAGEALTQAAESLGQVGEQVGSRSGRRAQLLEDALELHVQDGDQPCPVCAQGDLDAERAATLRRELDDLRADGKQWSDARQALTQVQRAAAALIQPTPAVLTARADDSFAERVATVEAAWDDWARVPDDPARLAAHVAGVDRVRTPLADLQQKVATRIDALDEAWARVASKLAAFADLVDAWQSHEAEASVATEAHAWLKANEAELRNERLRPIADEARRIWSALRQESNVDIANLTLEGSATRRRVEISAEVDGDGVGALSVMSQGELHSLALALFLPRAAMPASPFRFVVLDDPVQAMDPAKVDGLVSVLLDLAQTRQVVVFSHDDRFASAVRRAPSAVQVRLLEITREPGSRVTTRVALSPATRYLKDAFALTKDEGLPDTTLRRVLPGVLRLALEAQAKETFFARGLRSGAEPASLEEQWVDTQKTRGRMALALGDPGRIDAWLAQRGYRREALKKANAVHSGLAHGSALDACRAVEKTMQDLA